MRWFKLIISIIAVLAVLALGFMGLIIYSFKDGFMMIPQDCILLKRDIKGRVQDKNGQPIASAKLHIYAIDAKGFEAGKVDLHLTTDQKGHFGIIGVDVFACVTLYFEITATGYATKEMRFIAAQEQVNSVGDHENYGDPDYTAALANGNTPVLPRQITIELP